jgi:hypothetical protein
LVDGSSSNVTFGKNIIHGELQYRFVPVNLAQFFVPPIELGNIPPKAGKKRKGRIHSVEVIRGRTKVVYGQERLGGFIPPGSHYMIERDGAYKYPVHNLYAPSLSQMAAHIVDTDRSVMNFINNIYSIIENEIQL